MDRSFLLFLIGAGAAAYFLLGFLKEIEESDENLKKDKSSYSRKKVETVSYEQIDSVGRVILDVSGMSPSKQMQQWNQSQLKEEFLYFFPDFREMKLFVDDHVRGTYLREKLFKQLEQVERKFLGGRTDPAGAKAELSELK